VITMRCRSPFDRRDLVVLVTEFECNFEQEVNSVRIRVSEFCDRKTRAASSDVLVVGKTILTGYWLRGGM